MGRQADWLKRLKPEQRRLIYQRFNAGWRQTGGDIPVSYIEWLPSDLREAEALRHMALVSLAANPRQKLPYAGYLPGTPPECNLRLILATLTRN